MVESESASNALSVTYIEFLCFVFLWFGRFAAEAVGAVVVDDAAGLHPGVDDDGTDELEAAFLERC